MARLFSFLIYLLSQHIQNVQRSRLCAAGCLNVGDRSVTQEHCSFKIAERMSNICIAHFGGAAFRRTNWTTLMNIKRAAHTYLYI